MEFDEALAELGAVEQKCISLIDHDHAAQLDALTARIESLERELQARDDHIAILEDSRSQLTSRLEQAETMVDAIIHRLQQSHHLPDRLTAISETSDFSVKIGSLFKYIQKLQRSSNRLLVSMLRGHVDFLTRLAENPTVLSQFCVSATTGKTLFSAETGNLLLEQARRTAHFLADYVPSPIADVASIAGAFDLSMDLGHRADGLQALLAGGEISPPSVGALLLQEVAITSALRRYAEGLQAEATRANALGREAFRILAKAVGRDEEFTPERLAECARRAALRVAKGRRNQTERAWDEWSKTVYFAITGVDGAGVALGDIQIAIEEAALTAVGRVRRRKSKRIL